MINISHSITIFFLTANKNINRLILNSILHTSQSYICPTVCYATHTVLYIPHVHLLTPIITASLL
uniref:Uncharacterized protein n=1 Tax=Anguilla anguilla TaxID=7936 RepID=A0A0E9SQ92_ANGAN